MPDGFAAYCKIMHPLYREDGPSYSRIESEDWSSRVSWRDMATAFDVPFDSMLSWDSFWRSDRQRLERARLSTSEGNPGLRFCERTGGILQSHTTTPVYLWFSGTLRAVVDSSIPEVVEADLAELVDIVRDVSHGYNPEYCWPDDRSWCFQTDYDSDFSLVAGSQALVDQIMQDDDLEAIAVDRVDKLSSRGA
jgi:hypothetical protein